MKSSIFGVVTIGIAVAFLPLILQYDDADSLGQNLGGILESWAPTVLGLLLFIAAMALLATFFVSDDY